MVDCRHTVPQLKIKIKRHFSRLSSILFGFVKFHSAFKDPNPLSNRVFLH